MALEIGSRLGHYDVTALIGEGGMGQVYQATDTKLNRQVALKILPEAFAADPDRLARFQREAQVLASLNHPNIAQIHGIEEDEGTRALVLELVEGPTLADRIAKGPIPVDEALPIAKQIAEALEAAHEAGVIHRDLKPANIKVREDGTVKVLDFGLAKALDTTPQGDPSQSPTLTAAATQMGVIMGTAAYMSPEQARGKTVDKRADIWAFGVVLLEMLTGRKIFEGEDVSMTLSGVLQREPDWSHLPSAVSPSLSVFLHRCLEKDPKRRVRDIGDVRLALDGGFEGVARPAHDPAPSARARLWQRPMSIGLMSIMTAGAASLAVWTLMRPTPADPARFAITLPESHRIAFRVSGQNIALSPDGQTLVYADEVDDGRTQLFRRAMGDLEAVAIPGTAGALFPRFSSDGAWLVFSTGDTLEKVTVAGGSPVTLYTRQPGEYPIQDASWGLNDTIAFNPGGNNPLMRMSAQGGTVEPLTRLADGERDHRYPHFLPDGESLLFTAMTGQSGQVAVHVLATGERRMLVQGSSPRYVSTGHIAFVRSDGLWAVPFDLSRLEVTGTAVPILQDIRVSRAGHGEFAIAQNGSLVYVPGISNAGRSLVWVDRHGNEEPLAAEPRTYFFPRISPDGTRVALQVEDQENDVWIWDFVREAPIRLTFETGPDSYPAWTPDGTRVIFNSVRDGTPSKVFWKGSDGTGPVERLAEGQGALQPNSVSPDGRWLVLSQDHPDEGANLHVLSLTGSGTLEPLITTPFDERNGEVSPDGKWLAYESNASGQQEIYVRPFPNVDESQWPVSIDGGMAPSWSSDGRELFYMSTTPAPGNSQRLMAVPVETSPVLTFGRPEALFEGTYYPSTSTNRGRTYGVSPDGQRFLMIRVNNAPSDQLVIVLNWHEELKRLVPVD